MQNVVEEIRKGPFLTLNTPSLVTCLSYLDNRLYAGLQSGDLIIYSRDSGRISTSIPS